MKGFLSLTRRSLPFFQGSFDRIVPRKSIIPVRQYKTSTMAVCMTLALGGPYPAVSLAGLQVLL